jgi:hypothetical protein
MIWHIPSLWIKDLGFLPRDEIRARLSIGTNWHHDHEAETTTLAFGNCGYMQGSF